jgi:hypothetical protein
MGPPGAPKFAFPCPTGADSPRSAQRRFALVDLPSFARSGNHCVRFLGRRYRAIPTVVCVCRDRASHPSLDPLQRHDAPERCLKPQQLRETVGYEDRYQFLIYDRDGIFASHIDESIRALGIRVLKSAPRCPDPPATTKVLPEPSSRHRRGESYAVPAASVLGWLHHEYFADACRPIGFADYSSERPCRNAHCGQGVRSGGWTRSVETLT